LISDCSLADHLHWFARFAASGRRVVFASVSPLSLVRVLPTTISCKALPLQTDQKRRQLSPGNEQPTNPCRQTLALVSPKPPSDKESLLEGWIGAPRLNAHVPVQWHSHWSSQPPDESSCGTGIQALFVRAEKRMRMSGLALGPFSQADCPRWAWSLHSELSASDTQLPSWVHVTCSIRDGLVMFKRSRRSGQLRRDRLESYSSS
jgi:hypothetical protein